MMHSINVSHYYYKEEEGDAYNAGLKFRVEVNVTLLSESPIYSLSLSSGWFQASLSTFKSLFLSEPTPVSHPSADNLAGNKNQTY